MTKKKPAATTAPKVIEDETINPSPDVTGETEPPNESPLDSHDTNHVLEIDEAIAEGRDLISQGKPKVEAAMAIYRRLEELPQDTVVDAFIKGADLTSKGALTYWYNCRRKLKRERLKTS